MWWIVGGAGAALVFWALFLAGRRRFGWKPAVPMPDERRGSARRETVRFKAVDGVGIEGWLFLPDVEAPPIVLMAPGLTGTKEGPLERFAWTFAKAGYAVLAIDFRCFGGSDGVPRHWLDPLRQVEDYRAALSFIRSELSERVDTGRIVFWGSSFSGSAAIAAAENENIAAVIAQVPYLGGVPVHAPGALQIAGYIGLSICEGIGDVLAGLFGVKLAPVYITTYGRPGERTFAMSTANPLRRGGGLLHPFWAAIPNPQRGGWENAMLVRGLRNLDAVRAKDILPTLRFPVFLIAAVQDDMIAFDGLREAAERLPDGSRFLQFDCGHYDPYVDPIFETNVRAQVEFLQAVTISGQGLRSFA